MRLLLVEDNACLADLLKERLTAHGFVCEVAAGLEAGRALAATRSFDLVLLDLGLPDGDGLDWLRDRQDGPPLPPTLVLTARNALDDRVAGLNAGADDYLPKPFAFEELLARLRALMRRPGPRNQTTVEVGLLRLDTASRAGGYDNAPLDLSPREADLLELLMRNAGAVVPREILVKAFYGVEDDVSPNALEAIVSRVRRKIEGAGGMGLVHTVRGVGYLLRASPPP